MQNHKKKEITFVPWLYVPSYKLVLKGSIVRKIWETHMFQELNLYCDSLREASDPLIMAMNHNAVFGWQHSVTWKIFSTQNQDKHPGKCTDGMANSWTR